MSSDPALARGLAPAAVLALALLAPPAARGGENPHAFMRDPGRCKECHATTPERGNADYTTLTFTDTIVNLCASCHKEDHLRDEHPVEIHPEVSPPDDLHLDNFFTITCSTCHDAHGEPEAPHPYVAQGFRDRLRALLGRQTRWPTYFLRRPNASGELCEACHPGGSVVREGEAVPAAFPEYVGSEKCRECHPGEYDSWKLTLHARNFRDVRADARHIRGVFEGDTPFPPSEILWSVGEHWTQRYLVKGKKDDLVVVPDTWLVQARKWTKEGSFSRSWLKYCAGCHTTALDPYTGLFLEAGTGCEGCHGPGKKHAESTDQLEIVNPSVLVESRRDMICEACHTAGHDRSGTFRYPVGFRPGADLMRYYHGLVPKPGQDVTTYKGDGTYEDRHRQFLFWISRVDIMVGTTCDICSSTRAPPPGAEQAEQPEYRFSPDEWCGTCHREEKIAMRAHSGHDPSKAGCMDCHPPKVDESGTRYSIHDHKFRFGKPSPEHLAGGDPCQGCHERRRVKSPAAARARARAGAGTSEGAGRPGALAAR